MAGLVPAIHAPPLAAIVERFVRQNRVDGRDKPGHDVEGTMDDHER